MGGLHDLYVDGCRMDRERQSDVTIGVQKYGFCKPQD